MYTTQPTFITWYSQALDTGEGGHSIEYATNRERKPLNRFGNIVVCKSKDFYFLCVYVYVFVCMRERERERERES